MGIIVSVGYINNISAFIYVKKGILGFSTNSDVGVGEGIPIHQGNRHELRSDKEINNLYFRAYSIADVEFVIIIERS